ncbi:histone acetyltransferase KAT6B-like [Elysia marginata]|uniref:Histone acetyltransferase KAT6B-like n=1 Tax=Elysia marginata TaxID=1093978 RepID=A0AAV4GF94_9GAST|nr:histone acetyltransferase KAT6B-like [Elysia marginata]
MGNIVQDCEREWILEAINHLKHRKARPDLSRISLRMKRKHQINFAQTKKLLESLIESGIVVKAVYKNNTSYRDVSKWKKGKLGGHIQNSNKMLKRFVRAIEAKEIEKGTGVTCEEIEDFLRSQGEERCFLSGAALIGALEKEVSTGYLKKIHCGAVAKFLINEDNEHLINILKQTDDLDVDLEIDPCDDTQPTSNTIETDFIALQDQILEAVRETGHLNNTGSSACNIKQYLFEKHRLLQDDFPLDKLLEHFVMKKILKKTGEFYNIPDELSSSTRVSLPGSFETKNIEITPTHEISQLPDAGYNADEQQVKILQGLSLVPKSSTLKDSTLKPSNLQILPGLSHSTVENIKDAPYLGPSRPPSKRRRIVKDHGPDFEIEMPTKAKGKWQDTKDSVYPTPSNSPASERSECTFAESLKNPVPKKKRGRPKKVKEEVFPENTSRPATPSESLHAFPTTVDIDEDSRSCSPVHQDVSGWTSHQVADYFKGKGFIDESQRMLEHDIDGSALGLLRRSDVVGPPLGGILQVKKLGTALKLFRDIRDLLYQGHSNNYVDPYEERPFSRL